MIMQLIHTLLIMQLILTLMIMQLKPITLVPPLHMFYTERPFLRVGLPFLAAILFGTALLADTRKSRYSNSPRSRSIPTESENCAPRKSLKSLEEELAVLCAGCPLFSCF
jgi:hypothetical protein